jgi:hypothetical protein
MPSSRRFKEERGSSALFLFPGLMVVVAVGVGIVQWNKSTQYQLSQAVAKMEVDAILTGAQAGVRAALKDYPAEDCLPSALAEAKVKSYRRFDRDADIIEFTLDEKALVSEKTGCLLPKELLPRIETLKIKVSPLQENKDAMQRKVEVVTEVTTKAKKERFSRKARMARIYQFQPLSISRFGLMFMSSASDGPFVDLVGDDTNLRVFSNVLYADSTPPSLSQLINAHPERLMFERGNFARFKEVSSFEQNINNFRITYRNGLETAALDGSYIDQYLPRAGDPNWEQRFDYAAQYSNSGYPIPEIPGRTTASYCGPGGAHFDPSHAINTLPDAAHGPERTAQTCEPGVSHQSFLFINAKENLTSSAPTTVISAASS